MGAALLHSISFAFPIHQPICQTMKNPVSQGQNSISMLLPSVLSGLVLHFAFNKLEKTYLLLLERLLAVFPLLPAYFLWPYCSYTALFFAYAVCYATLVSSTLAYRLSPLHPLYKYPGPILAKCTKLWGIYQTYTGKAHIATLGLHRKYGSVVRTGPNELSITEVDAVQPVLGLDGLRKGPIWDGRRASVNKRYASVIGMRNTAEHLQRRKYWNKGLNISSIKEYQPILKKRVNQLADLLKTKASEKRPVDLAELLSFFAYDFMGDMAFGGGFELMRDGDTEHLWKLMENGIIVHSYSQHIPWAAPLLLDLSNAGKASEKLSAFSIEQSRKRMEHGSSERDLSSYLLGEVSNSLKPLHFEEYSAEASLVIIAGSDTTATVLSNIFFNLIIHRNIYDRLRVEVEEYYPRSEGVGPTENMSKLAEMPLLNGVINETLRLYPPVPVWVQRSVDEGRGGKLAGSIFIPDGTAVNIPPYAIHRDPRYFSPDPDSFIPDRWINVDSSYETDQAALYPQLELRVVVASLVRDLDFKFQDDWDTMNWEKELEDKFLLKKGKLPVELSLRMEPEL
ncbi:high nitrogen upregulated cytochrome P450 monooxygenase 2 [Cyathus striatus]|nr:high nitrogen upregulated cytochrome P450 monooxygenase 2 [Cyathus striatus]